MTSSRSEKKGSCEEPRSSPLFRAALLFLAAYGLLSGILSIALAATIPAHLENSYTEAPTVYAALASARTGHIYYAWNAPPYMPQPYGPLFYAYNAALARTAHGDIFKTLALSRSFSFAAYLLCPLLIYAICRKLEFPVSRAAIAALVFLGLPYSFPMDVSVRPDFPSLALMLLSLLCALRAGSQAWAYVPAGLLAGAGFLIKQPAFVVCVAIAGVLLVRRRFTQTAAFLAGAAAPVVAVLALLIWRHEPFWTQLTVLRGAIWSLQGGANWVWGMLRNPNGLIPVAMLAIGFPLAARGNLRSQMAASFALINLGAGLATIPQAGGGVNYFYPAFAGGAILLPFANEWTARSGKALQTITCALTMIWLSMGFVKDIGPRWTALRAPLQQPEIPLETLRNLRIFSDRPYFDLLGRDPEFLDPEFLHMLALRGRWDEGPLLESARDAKFDLVILAVAAPGILNYRGVSALAPAVVNALNENYEPLCIALPRYSIGYGMVLRPRERSVPVTAEMMTRTLQRPCVETPRGRAPGLFVYPSAR